MEMRFTTILCTCIIALAMIFVTSVSTSAMTVSDNANVVPTLMHPDGNVLSVEMTPILDITLYTPAGTPNIDGVSDLTLTGTEPIAKAISLAINLTTYTAKITATRTTNTPLESTPENLAQIHTKMSQTSEVAIIAYMKPATNIATTPKTSGDILIA